MKTEWKKLGAAGLNLVFLAAVLLMVHTAGAEARISERSNPGGIHKTQTDVVALDADAFKVLVVLESGLQGRSLPEQAENKLSVMDKTRMKLLSQLSDRVLDRDHPTGSRLAFFLMTMLIIL